MKDIVKVGWTVVSMDELLVEKKVAVMVFWLVSKTVERRADYWVQ